MDETIYVIFKVQFDFEECASVYISTLHFEAKIKDRVNRVRYTIKLHKLDLISAVLLVCFKTKSH